MTDTASNNPNPTPAEHSTQPVAPHRNQVLERAAEWLAPRWTAIYRFAVVALLAYIAFKPPNVFVEGGWLRVGGRVEVSSLPGVRVDSLPSVSVDSLPNHIQVWTR